MSSARQAGLGERVIEVIAAIELVDLALFASILSPQPASMSTVVSPPDEQRPHAERDAVAIVGRQPLLPQRPRHHAEHRAAVEAEEAVGQRDQLEVAERMPAGAREQLDLRRRLLQLDEHAVRGRRVNERDQRAFGARPRLLVDQPDAARLQVRERRVDVVDAQRDVMQAGAALLDELGDRRIGAVASSSSSVDCPVGRKCARTRWRRNLLAAPRPQAERVAKNASAACRSLDRDADVIENGFHRGSGSGSGSRLKRSRQDIRGGRVRIELARRRSASTSASNSPGASRPRSTCSMKRCVSSSRRRNSLRAFSRVARVPSACARNAVDRLPTARRRPCRSSPRS